MMFPMRVFLHPGETPDERRKRIDKKRAEQERKWREEEREEEYDEIDGIEDADY